MKINLSLIDRTQFLVHEHVLAGKKVFLVQPQHIGCAWSKDNLHFRSSVWDEDGNLVSASFPKFFNADEKPDIFPLPANIKGGKALEKVDGSTLIFSLFNDQIIARTRGTVDATLQENGNEIAFLKEKYPGIEMVLNDLGPDASFIFEWTTPTNKIVLDYGPEPDIRLIGAIVHEDYSLITQDHLDEIASQYGFKRPEVYSFSTMEELRETVEAFDGKEGVCFYYNGDQNIRKFKGIQYLSLHRMKSEVSSFEKVVDLFFNYSDLLGHHASYSEFFGYVETTFDYEIANTARSHISMICDGMKDVAKIEAGMKAFAEKLSNMTRKDQAAKVFQAYGQTNRASFVFKILDGKAWDADTYKKLLYQCIKS